MISHCQDCQSFIAGGVTAADAAADGIVAADGVVVDVVGVVDVDAVDAVVAVVGVVAAVGGAVGHWEAVVCSREHWRQPWRSRRHRRHSRTRKTAGGIRASS